MTLVKEQLTEEQKLAQFMALAEGDINDIEDLPEYATFEAGTYNVRGSGAKLNAEKGAVNLSMELVAMVELADDANPEAVPAAGSLLGSNYYGKFGLQKMKKVFKPVMDVLGTSSVVGLLDQFENLDLLVVLTKRVDKEDDKKFYNDIAAVMLQP